MVQLTLSQGDAVAKLESFCVFANKFSDQEWVDWMDQMATDAEALLERIDRRRQRERDAGAKKPELDTLVRHLRDSAKPSRALRDTLSEALGNHRLYRNLSFDAAACKVIESTTHPASTPTKTLIAFALCLAIRDGYWQEFRRCREPKCREFFFDYKERGRPSQRYCCDRHRDNHSKRIMRGSA